MIESMRAFGYSPATAVADLVDNSITAGARIIEITVHWAGEDSWIAIADDGHGMSEPEPRQPGAGAAAGDGARQPQPHGRPRPRGPGSIRARTQDRLVLTVPDPHG